MIFTKTKLDGAFVIEPEMVEDIRGFFARTWCYDEFKTYGLNPQLLQCGISFSKKKGTLRGMHYQTAPFREAKLIRCTRGRIYDVIIDLRSESPTFKQYFSAILTDENRKMIYVPEDFAHGFQTLDDNTEVLYQMSEVYAAQYMKGVRWNDPAFNISWPIDKPIVLERDQKYPNF